MLLTYFQYFPFRVGLDSAVLLFRYRLFSSADSLLFCSQKDELNMCLVFLMRGNSTTALIKRFLLHRNFRNSDSIAAFDLILLQEFYSTTLFLISMVIILSLEFDKFPKFLEDCRTVVVKTFMFVGTSLKKLFRTMRIQSDVDR